MVILGSQNEITDFLMILAWASPFNKMFISITSVMYIISVLCGTGWLCVRIDRPLTLN